MKDKHYNSLDELLEEIKGIPIEELVEPLDGPHLISVDELRAAGALDVPAAWRKSLGEERDLFSDLIADEDAEKQPPASVEPDQ